MQQVNQIAISDITKHPRSSFESFDDVLNYARKGIEYINHRMAIRKGNFVKIYVEGEIYIVFDSCVTFQNSKYDLIIGCVLPAIKMQSFFFRFSKGGGVISRKTRNNMDWGNDPVLVFDAYPVKCPNKTVFSFVWLERTQERENLFGESIAPTVIEPVQSSNIVEDRERGFVGIRNGFGGNGNSIPSVIKSRPKIINSISGHGCKNVRNWFSKFNCNLFQFLNSMQVGITDNSVWFFLQKGTYPFVKINDVFLTPRETEFCAME